MMVRSSPLSFRHLAIVPVLAMLLAATPTRAAESDTPDASTTFDAQTKADIQTVISGQLAAFDKGDAKAAEDFAAPAIKEKFPDPTQFLSMVKTQYGALIHARNTQFTGVSGSPHGPLQKMTLTDSEGLVWSVIYSLEKVDGTWRITGCGIEKDANQQAI